MKPTALVRFAGSDQTCLVEHAVIRHGRDDPSSQPVADAASLDVFGAIPAGVDVSSAIEVVAIVAGVEYPRFAGRISDLNIGWRSIDEPIARIIAVGELASMGRRVVGDAPWPAELDGARANRVIDLAGVPTDALRTDPGTVQVLARDVDAQPALAVASEAASDGMGMLWQAKDGAVLYADAVHRKAAWPATFALDACILPLSVTWAKNLEGLCNDARIRYGLPEAELHATDADSIADLGTFAASLSTRLATLSDANARAQYMLIRQSRPAWVLAGVQVWLELIGSMRDLDAAANAAQTAEILDLEIHDLVSVTGLPAGSPYTSAVLWIEGWAETIEADSWRIEYATSDYCRSATAPRWDDVEPGSTWDTIDAGLTWDAITCLPPAPPYGRWNDQPASLRWDQAGADAWDNWS